MPRPIFRKKNLLQGMFFFERILNLQKTYTNFCIGPNEKAGGPVKL